MKKLVALPARTGYSELQPRLIISTVERLEQRIGERFPDSGLSRVAGEMHLLAMETERIAARLRRPIWPIRIATFAGVGAILVFALMLASLFISVSSGDSPGRENLSEMLQGVEAGINEVVFLSLAVFFLMSLEQRVKRRGALKALHPLRSIVHIVDMHQLTKDPQFVLAGGRDTVSSPQRTLTRFELARYLDYCSELLSLSSKLAALHVQYVNDPVVLDAVNDIETLAASLSNKVWQKIMMLDTMGTGEPAPEAGQ